MFVLFAVSPVLTRRFSPQDLNKSGVSLECRTTTKFINLCCKMFLIGIWPKCIVIMYMYMLILFQVNPIRNKKIGNKAYINQWVLVCKTLRSSEQMLLSCEM